MPICNTNNHQCWLTKTNQFKCGKKHSRAGSIFTVQHNKSPINLFWKAFNRAASIHQGQTYMHLNISVYLLPALTQVKLLRKSQVVRLWFQKSFINYINPSCFHCLRWQPLILWIVYKFPNPVEW